ncbi:MAG: signal peptidase I [Thomasclavelia sp.]|uniref:signal peptidase I n=1 Tax=Thomasclavelia sp. TaxID=3025757 RepID=UPI0039A1AD4F
MKILKKIISYLSILCYIVIIVLVLILAPMIIGYKPVVVLSGSMEPAYPVGSLIYYKTASFEDIDKNDAITFYIDSDTLVTHRVVVKNEISQTFVTKGDANPTNDADPVEYKNVAGKALEIYLPVIGSVFASSVKYIAVAVIGGILLLNIILSNLIVDEKQPKEEVTV